VKPRRLLTTRQVGMPEVLTDEVAGFAVVRRLAVRFQALLRHRNESRLGRWIEDAEDCGIPAIVSFARSLMFDIQAIRNAVIEPWSNGQTEGQINRLKTSKRAMFGRADTDLPRVRMIPIDEIFVHQLRMILLN
jgi:transposase